MENYGTLATTETYPEIRTYLAWSMKLSAWFGGTGSPYTSSLAQAKRFPNREAAIAFCKRHYDNQIGLGAVPIAEADILELMRK